MNILLPIFFISLLGGQLFRIPVYQGIAVYPHDCMAGLCLLFWVFSRRSEGKKHVPTLLFPLKLFFLAVLISIAVNINSHTVLQVIEGVAYMTRFFLYIGLYFVFLTAKQSIKWLKWLYGVGVAFALLGIAQYILYPNLRNLSYLGWDPHYYRLFSTFLDPNFAGLYISLAFFLGIYIYSIVKLKSIIIVSQILLLASLVLTASRSGFLALSIPFVFFLLAKRSIKLFLVLILFSCLFLFIPLPNRGFTPLLRMDSSIARIDNWKTSLTLIAQKPVFGYGFNFLRSIQQPSIEENGISHATAGVDNSFLFVLATTGIVGVATFIYLLASIWKLGNKLYKQKKEKTLGIVYFLMIIAIGIHCMFINSFFYPWILIWLWIITGAIESKSSGVTN